LRIGVLFFAKAPAHLSKPKRIAMGESDRSWQSDGWIKPLVKRRPREDYRELESRGCTATFDPAPRDIV
jgi:hypothetical protein